MKGLFSGRSLQLDLVEAFCQLFGINVAQREANLIHRRGDQRVDESVRICEYLRSE